MVLENRLTRKERIKEVAKELRRIANMGQLRDLSYKVLIKAIGIYKGQRLYFTNEGLRVCEREYCGEFEFLKSLDYPPSTRYLIDHPPSWGTYRTKFSEPAYPIEMLAPDPFENIVINYNISMEDLKKLNTKVETLLETRARAK